MVYVWLMMSQKEKHNRGACAPTVSEGEIRNQSPRARAVAVIKGWICDGTLAAGMPIPPERDLAQRLSLPRATVARALKMLENEGVLSFAGARTRVVACRPSGYGISGLIRSSVLLLSSSLEPMPEHRQWGWADWVVQGAAAELRSRGYGVFSLDPRTASAGTASDFLRDPPAGIIVPEVFFEERKGTMADPQVLRRFLDSGIPVAVYGGEDGVSCFDRVLSDHQAGAYELVKLLIERGRKAPVMVFSGSGKSRWMEDRVIGYESALKDFGMSPKPILCVPDFPGEYSESAEYFEETSRFTAGYLSDLFRNGAQCDSILAVSDGKVFPVMRALEILGRSSHSDVAVAGYDNYYLDSWERRFFDAVPFATVDKRNYEMGREMAGLLAGRISGENTGDPAIRKVKPEIITDCGVARVFRV